MTEEIIARLRSLDLSDGGSHLSAIASCFYQPTFGWTGGSCEILRDLLIEILEGKDVNDDNDHAHAHGCDYGHHRCDQHQVSYDELGNERHKAVCELRGISIDALCRKYDYIDIYPEFIWAVGRAIGLRHDASFNGASFEEIINRLIHLLGEDEPDLQKSQVFEDSDAEGAVEIAITDELENERHKAVRKLRDARDSMSDSFVDNVSRIVCAIDARPEVGERVCKAIADRLIHLLDGVHKPDAALPTYDVLGNERHKAVCRLREWSPDEDGRPCREFWEAVMGEKLPTVPLKGDAELDIIMRDRLIHLLGGNECNFSGVKSYTDAMGGKSNPAETSDESTDHVTLATPSSEDETCPNPVRDASIIDKLDNERHKAIAGLRKVCTKLDESVWTWIEDVAIAIGAQDKQSDKYESMLPEITDRLIHLLGGDQPTLSDLYGILQDGEESENKDSESAHKMTKSAEIAKPESEDGGENCRTTDEKLNGESLIESLVKSTEELSSQGKVKFPSNEDGSLDSLKTVEEAEELIEDVKRRADQSHDSSPMRQENETRITDELRDYLGKNGQEYDNFKGEMIGSISGGLSSIYAIADRIDTQFDRICEHQEAVLQDTIDYMTELREHDAEYALAERDVLREKCDRLKAKVEHQREQLAVYATTYDFDAIRALKRERNEHKHRADNAEGHVKSLERRLDAVHETYCALLNDAAREFRALTEERDELQAKLDDYDKTHVALPKDANGDYWHIGDESEYGEVTGILFNSTRALIEIRMGNGERNMFGVSLAHKANPVTVEQVIRDLTLGKITEAQAIERIEGINGQG